MGCDNMPTKSSADRYDMREHEALQLVLENLSMIGLNSSTFFEKEVSQSQSDDDLSNDLVETKRISANITENIPVPSSEHVAEIVGKQGCKIKALRNKTNTYIKTPGRGDEPVFIITGRRDDVDIAKAEILQASDHFSNIRAQRKGIAPPPIQPGQITKTIRVPYRVVGLVVGPKGQTIKQIQQKTQTYIVTPSRERDPVFEITGLPENVEHARTEISNYIAARTGTFIDAEKKAIAPASGTAVWTNNPDESKVDDQICEYLEDIFSSAKLSNGSKRGSNEESLDSTGSLPDQGIGQNSVNGLVDSFLVWQTPLFNDSSVAPKNDDRVIKPPSPSHKFSSSTSSDAPSSSGYSSFSFELSPLVRSSSFPASDHSNGLALDACRSTALTSTCIATQTSSDPWSIDRKAANSSNAFCLPAYASAFNVSAASGVDDLPGGDIQSQNATTGVCVICDSKPISAALVPCGHKLFCYDCVSNLVQSTDALCPVCHQAAQHALRILQ